MFCEFVLQTHFFVKKNLIKIWCVYVVRSAIWYHLYNFKNRKKTHGGVSLLVKSESGFTVRSVETGLER